ncbi:TetR family transcriptional regulator [Xylophilus rhododendri]|uniref:TetR family transcriptional regulator n=1 Tax=Xylophilus rhododendri TaxID=2697032 RepID=A0A857J8K5_9BURK|nr:TetR/AcrR family transcriptional regulator [Xylophilus rhododendri]QHJ00305.1 TetR family transcriptional regulator [Xylophilus rhododendri]
MPANTLSRPATRSGGRSARVQAAVHEAVQALSQEVDRTELTVPLVAARAGVTPSTIYRRWGDLSALLADVAAARLRPEHEPPDTGTFRDDLLAWAELFVEEMASEPGLALVRDVICGGHRIDGACSCLVFTAGQITQMVERARARGEDVPPVEEVVDRVAAPVVYRLLMGVSDGVDAAYARRLATGCLDGHRPAGRD